MPRWSRKRYRCLAAAKRANNGKISRVVLKKHTDKERQKA